MTACGYTLAERKNRRPVREILDIPDRPGIFSLKNSGPDSSCGWIREKRISAESKVLDLEVRNVCELPEL